MSVVSLSNFGCVPEIRPIEFESFISTFKEEAKKRDVKLNLANLEYKYNYKNDGSSYCESTSKGRTIFINKIAWDGLNKFEKEGLFFHEMGHCVLALQHQNCQLPDSTSQTIMCGEGNGCIGSRNVCFKIYSPLKRKYYLDYLFGTDLNLPWWSKLDEYSDKTKEKEILVSEEFRDSLNFYTLGNQVKLENGKLLLKDAVVRFSNKTKESINLDNIEIETNFSLIDKTYSEINFYFLPKFDDFYNSLILKIDKLNSDYTLRITFNGNAGFIRKLDQKEISNENIFKIQNIDRVLYIYLNNKLFFIQDLIPVQDSNIKRNNLPVFGEYSILSEGNVLLDFVKISTIKKAP